MTFATIELEQSGPVAILSLNRPDKLNAINADMLREINLALDEIESNDSVYALVLNGRGRAFCAGFDLQAGIEANRSTREEWQAAIDADLDMIMRFWHCPKPTIAVVHGYVLAGGFEIALACDMTVCESNALFGEPELRFGSSIVALLLPWYVNPEARQKTAAHRAGPHARRRGAGTRGSSTKWSTKARGSSCGLALAREVALMDPDSVRMTKQAINQTYDIMGMARALRMGADTSIDIETLETELRNQFNQILRTEGMKAALAWREARLDNND